MFFTAILLSVSSVIVSGGKSEKEIHFDMSGPVIRTQVVEVEQVKTSKKVEKKKIELALNEIKGKVSQGFVDVAYRLISQFDAAERGEGESNPWKSAEDVLSCQAMEFYLGGDLIHVNVDLLASLEHTLSYIIAKQEDDIEALRQTLVNSQENPETSVELSTKKKLRMELMRILSFGFLMNSGFKLSTKTRKITENRLIRSVSVLKALFGLAAKGQPFAWEVIGKKTSDWQGSQLSFIEIEALVKTGMDSGDTAVLQKAASAVAAKNLHDSDMSDALELLGVLVAGAAGERIDEAKLNRILITLPVEIDASRVDMKIEANLADYVKQGVALLQLLIRNFGKEPPKGDEEFRRQVDIVEFLKATLDDLILQEATEAEVAAYTVPRVATYVKALRTASVTSQKGSVRGSMSRTSTGSSSSLSVDEASGAIVSSLETLEEATDLDLMSVVFESEQQLAEAENGALPVDAAELVSSKLSVIAASMAQELGSIHSSSFDLVSLYLEATLEVLKFSENLKRNDVHIYFLKSTFKVLKSLQSDPPSSLDSVLSESELPSTDLLSLTNQLLETVSSPKFRISPSSRALLKRWVLTLVADSTAPREALELGVELGCRVFSMEPSAGSRPTPVESSVLEGLKWVSTLLHNAKIEVLQDAAMAVSRADEGSLPRMGKVLAALLSRPEFRALAGRLSLEGVEEAAQEMERLAAIGNFKKMKSEAKEIQKFLARSLLSVRRKRISRD